jgi:hypothetical protein
MKGIQKQVYEAISKVMDRIEEGFYGEDDNFDVNAVMDDLNEINNPQ